MTRSYSPFSAAFAVGLSLFAVPATGQTPAQPTPTPAPASAPATQPQTQPILIDGDHADWLGIPNSQNLTADARHVYLRFRFSRSRTLLRHGESVVVDLNTDNNPATGLSSTDSRHSTPGIELRIELNPASDRRDRDTPPVRVTRFDTDGTPTDLHPRAIALHTAPSHASKTFEVRFSRTIDGDPDRPAARGLTTEDPSEIHAALYRRHHSSPRTAGLAIATAPLPPFAADEPALVTIPAKPENAIRVVAWNTLWGTQLKNPTPFARVVQALDADVYLLQEWSDRPYPARSVADWFNEHNPGPPDADRPAWTAVTTEHDNRGSGIAIASRYPILATGPASMTVRSRTRWTFPVRFAAVVLDTPLGPGVFGTVHHKAGGRLGSEEDRRRLEEAAAINSVLARLAARQRAAFTVFGGDFNMNGTSRVMDQAIRRLDRDRSALIPAPATVLHNPGVLYTHSRSTPKLRLDYITYADAALTPANAFVLDTAILPQATLDQHDLAKNDSRKSDHLPVVVDFVPLRRGQ
ncbi:MAG: endonuclease/exonuclease/phosphatase family protein [Planctomycetota bacterium]